MPVVRGLAKIKELISNPDSIISQCFAKVLTAVLWLAAANCTSEGQTFAFCRSKQITAQNYFKAASALLSWPSIPGISSFLQVPTLSRYQVESAGAPNA